MNRVKQLAQETEEEMDTYLDYLGWDSNPFVGQSNVEEYVIPSQADLADVVSAVQNYTGAIVIHSKFTGAGKTTLARVVMDSFEDSHNTVFVGEHNATVSELVSIIADKSGVGKSNSTKRTEAKLERADFDEPLLVAVDEFGLNEPASIHALQFLNDLEDCKLLLTGMSDQYQTLMDGRWKDTPQSVQKAVARRVSYALELEPFEFEQTEELTKRRIAGVTGVNYDEWEAVDYSEFITTSALRELHNRAGGVAGVVIPKLNEALSLGAYRHSQGVDGTIQKGLVEKLEYPDAQAVE